MTISPRITPSLLAALLVSGMSGETRPRAREIGLAPGILRPGPLNAITDVAGVRVGQVTLQDDARRVHTGVTAILPHGGNLFQQKVPAAIYVGNGFGKLTGSTQVEELGVIETPVVLTNTLGVWQAGEAVVEYTLAQPGNEKVVSVNPVVGETNDGGLNDIRSLPVRREHVLEAIRAARGGPVEEGAVGAGTGTKAFGFKGGIGTSSRVLPAGLGGYTLGVLVQSNFGGILTMDGVPVGRELGRYLLKNETGDGSLMMVVATDAPVDARELKRIARRAMLGMARTGSPSSHGSGDYVIAFSTVRQPANLLADEALTPLFEAAVEATEEAIYNSLLKAAGPNALPLDRLREILRKYGR
ncbi:MAG TPA: P1 family peptidase [Bryobacteraceae bacterium]|nr:P1 family peptidase [Bryobacteraceae bacterium]